MFPDLPKYTFTPINYNIPITIAIILENSIENLLIIKAHFQYFYFLNLDTKIKLNIISNDKIIIKLFINIESIAQ
ncbi:hypothetical protein [Aliarcobacter cryaerophilus]|uniref:hypothetical protein n=1 Tax=Aliarcobacter cryaerophilus TaxID=28198 RepID=UPI000AC4820B|nr:hypothetical protein [Aliarcobacter cryaerophilus]